MLLLLLLGGGLYGVDVGLGSIDARSCRCRGRGGRIGRREIFVFRTASNPLSAVYCVGIVVCVGRPRPRFGRAGRHLVEVQGIFGLFLQARSLACLLLGDRSCQSMDPWDVIKRSECDRWVGNVVAKTITEIWPWAWRRW